MEIMSHLKYFPCQNGVSFSPKASLVSLNEYHTWFQVNLNLIGFYRVKYSDKMLQLLIPHIVNASLGSLDRMGIQNDLMALVSLKERSIKTNRDVFLIVTFL